MARILVIGGYGLVGSNVSRALAEQGHEVVALGRDRTTARRVLPGYTWVFRDLRDLTRPDDWLPIVTGMDFVVNCAGALQASLHDNLEKVHLQSIGALVMACEKTDAAIIQISAAGADQTATLPFFRTKAEGDALVREASVDWWVFRPGFVLAQSSYGGSTLVRILASVPIIQPIALPHARIQMIYAGDIGAAVLRAVDGETPPGLVADLVQDDAHDLIDIFSATRRWLGFAPAVATIVMPHWLLWLVGAIADVFGLIGWRSAIRSTALRAIAQGVTGNPTETRRALGRPALSLPETLRVMPARAEDRLFARIQLLAPFFLFALALTWIWKGAMGLVYLDDVIVIGTSRGIPDLTMRIVVASTALVSIALGLSVFVRPWAVRTLVVMVFVTIFYGAAVTFMAPHLWFDPLGAGANIVVVAIALLAARVMLDTR